VATGSGHYIPFDKPEMVVEAIREVVEKARAK
jgi:carboxypeptidase C (cathepsin A)